MFWLGITIGVLAGIVFTLIVFALVGAMDRLVLYNKKENDRIIADMEKDIIGFEG